MNLELHVVLIQALKQEVLDFESMHLHTHLADPTGLIIQAPRSDQSFLLQISNLETDFARICLEYLQSNKQMLSPFLS